MPPTIQILDPLVSNQIAAGEVVERPASVLKELVENALDAHASQIFVDVAGAGLKLVRVSDNGEGIPSGELQLAVQRHATSKITQAEDLNSIQSFGFRGEALPSIASVSRFSMSSRGLGSELGERLELEGGRQLSLESVAMPQGSRVEVRDLFFNAPARLKFMKALATEGSRLQYELLRLALAHPQVEFQLHSEGKLSLSFPKTDLLRERVAQALGSGFLTQSLELNFQARDGIQISGWIGRPQQNRSNRSGQYLLVNQRAVEHRLLGFNLSQAFGSLIAQGRHPVAVVFLSLDPQGLDVNVHPAKREVRFSDERLVLDSIRHAVQDALNRASLGPSYQLPNPNAELSRHGIETFARSFYSPASAIQNEGAFAALSDPAASLGPSQAASGWIREMAEPQREDWPRPLAQLHQSYILCQEAAGLAIVDQHAAHERVLYEKICKELGSGEVKSQRLLLPQRLHLGPAQGQRLRASIEALAGLGLEIQDLGNDSFYLLAIPAYLKKLQVAPLLQELMDEIGEEQEKAPLEFFRRDIAAHLACRAAVKAGDPLQIEEMQNILSELSRCEIPWSCPHGRPPLVHLPLSDLEKYFDRR